MGFIKKLIRNNYYLYSLYYFLYFTLRDIFSVQPPILVFTVGKTGSSSVYDSIKASGYKGAVYHIHRLSKKGLAEAEEKKINTKNIKNNTGQGILAGHYLGGKVKSKRRDARWKVVSVIREPVSRNISAFFQEIDYWAPGYLRRFLAGENVTDSLIEIFLEKYNHNLVLNWLEVEVLEALNVDVYSEPFEKDKGYKLYESDSVEFLLLRLENLISNENIMSYFFNIKGFELSNSNESSKKTYKVLYADFLNKIIFPKELLDKMYQSQFSTHFYSNEQIDTFYKKWRCS